MAISLQRVIRSTSCLVLRWGFLGRRIERRYLRFEQIQDGGCRHSWKNFKNGHISATGRPIDLIYIWLYGGVFWDGGSNGAIFDSNKFKMAAPAILDNFEWPYLHNSSWSTYKRASRGHLCYSTAFLLLLEKTDLSCRMPKLQGRVTKSTRKLYYRKDDRAMRAI